MSRRTITRTDLVDDLTGEPADSTVTFAFSGQQYEIELSSENAATLREALAPYIEKGRQISGPRRQRPVTTKQRTPAVTRGHGRTPAAQSSDQPEVLGYKVIKDWARKNGYRVNDRGRVPQRLVDAFRDNHPHLRDVPIRRA